MEGVAIVAIAIAVLVFILRNKKKTGEPLPGKEKAGASSSASDSAESGAGRLVLGDEYKSTEPVKVVNNNHVIETIYMYTEEESAWVCPNCEVENGRHHSVCCVCGYSK